MPIHAIRRLGARSATHARRVLAAAALVSVGFASPQAAAQVDCGVPSVMDYTGWARTYPIPLDAFGSMTFTCKGGDGGDAAMQAQGMAGPFDLCRRAKGGKGAEVRGTFNIGTAPGEIAPGGSLRFIVGGAGATGEKVVGWLTYHTGKTTGAGGGGSAVLYLPPNADPAACANWQVLLVAGGGGGAHEATDARICNASRDGSHGRLTQSGSSGGGNWGGGGNSGGNGAGCGGDPVTDNSGGGGGGMNSPGGCVRGGGAGGCTGGHGGSGDRHGGWGFGGGGGAKNKGGGGGGGYSGGGGGDNGHGGGGGGSYISPFAIDPLPRVSTNPMKNGRITWTAPVNFFVNDECETAIPVSHGSFRGCTLAATDSGLGGGPLVFYSYTNDGICDKIVTARLAETNTHNVGAWSACDGPIIDRLMELERLIGGGIEWAVPPGETHYILVSAWSTPGTFRLDVNIRDRDDDSLLADDFEGGDTLWPGSGIASCFGSGDAPDRVFAYVNRSGVPETVTAHTCLPTTNFDTVLSIVEACSGALVVCDSDSCADDKSFVTWTAKPGVRYLVRVSGENGDSGSFAIDLEARPVNDTCADAIPLRPNTSYRGEHYAATASGFSGACAGPAERDMWFSYTHPDPDGCPSIVSFQTQSLDTSLAYEVVSDCNAPTTLDCLPRLDTRDFLVQPGQTIYLRVTAPQAPPFVMVGPEYAFSFFEGPNPAARNTLPGVRGGTLIDNSFDMWPEPSCSTGLNRGELNDTFYNYFSTPIILRLDTCALGPLDTVIGVFVYRPNPQTGECELTEIACADDGDACHPMNATMNVVVEPGEWIEIVVTKNTPGSADVRLDMSLAGYPPPSNDACAGATQVTDGTYFGANYGATSTGPAPSCDDGNGGKRLWYRYTNDTECPKRVTASTCNLSTNFQTGISVYDTCAGIEIACERPAIGCLGGTSVSWVIEPGQTHLIGVGSFDKDIDEGGFRLDVSSELIDTLGFGLPSECAARNDDCSLALPVNEDGTLGTLANATHDTTPSCIASPMPDVWYAYTNPDPTPRTVIASTCNGQFVAEPRSVTVYDTCGGSELACNAGTGALPCSEVVWDVPAGATHYIRVSAVPGLPTLDDEFILTVTPFVRPGNECPDALPASLGAHDGALTFNTGGADDTPGCAANDTIDAWYTFTPPTDGLYRVFTCDGATDFDTALAIFDACPESGGTPLMCNDDANSGAPYDCVVPEVHTLSRRASYLELAATGATTYMIRVSAYNDSVGDGNFRLIIARAADECEHAEPISEGVFVRSLDGMTGDFDDDPCGAGNVIDYWFRYTVSQDGPIEIHTCGPATQFDTVLSVFSSCTGGGGLPPACNDDRPAEAPANCGERQSWLPGTVQAGTVFYIRVSAYADNTSAGAGFQLTIARTGCACDWNHDGALNDQDFFDWVNDYFTQTGPQGQFDFNEDGFANDQDWFDFTNCYFTPPATCQ